MLSQFVHPSTEDDSRLFFKHVFEPEKLSFSLNVLVSVLKSLLEMKSCKYNVYSSIIPFPKIFVVRIVILPLEYSKVSTVTTPLSYMMYICLILSSQCIIGRFSNIALSLFSAFFSPCFGQYFSC